MVRPTSGIAVEQRYIVKMNLSTGNKLLYERLEDEGDIAAGLPFVAGIHEQNVVRREFLYHRTIDRLDWQAD